MAEAEPEPTFSGYVREWHVDDGWGVLVSDSLPHAVWAGFGVIEMDGFRELTPGEPVVFTAEAADQDGYRLRALRVWRGHHAREPRPRPEGGPGYVSHLNITYDT